MGAQNGLILEPVFLSVFDLDLERFGGPEWIKIGQFRWRKRQCLAQMYISQNDDKPKENIIFEDMRNKIWTKM